MSFLKTFLGYLGWHYSQAFFAISSIWKNIAVFIFHYLSFKSLLGNFFTPWKRLAEGYPRRFDLKKYSTTFLLNTLMRIVGIILRTVMLVLACIIYLIFLVLTPVLFIIWLLLPFIVIFCIVFGLKLLLIP